MNSKQENKSTPTAEETKTIKEAEISQPVKETTENNKMGEQEKDSAKNDNQENQGNTVKQTVDNKGKEWIKDSWIKTQQIVKQLVEVGQRLFQDIISPDNSEPKAEVLTSAKDSIDTHLKKDTQEKLDSRLQMACILFLSALFTLSDDWAKGIRPAKEFIGHFKPDLPNSTNWLSKPVKNINRFLSNYMLIAILVLFVNTIFSDLSRPIEPYNFVLFSALMITTVIYIILKVANQEHGPLMVRGYAITLTHQKFVLGVIATPFLLHYGILNALFWSICSFTIFVLSHASLHSDYQFTNSKSE